MISPRDITSNPRLGGLVKRYHTWPVSREQNVAEHTWHVLRLLHTIFPTKMSHNVWAYALYHDVAEIKCGDAPHPIKILYPELRPIHDKMESDALRDMEITMPEITSEQKLLVKTCDLLEMWEFAMEERVRGNRFADSILMNVEASIFKLAADAGVHQTVLIYMTQFSSKMAI